MAIAKANNVGLDHRVKVGDRVVIPGNAPRRASPRRPRRPSRPSRALRPPSAEVTPVVNRRTRPRSRRSSRRQARAWSRPPPIRCPSGADRHDRRRQSVAELPLAGARPRHHGLRPEAERRQNDGINVAVPEGTPIKAAEEGVVAYAGNELKGYGNLVLVRHPNGYRHRLRACERADGEEAARR